jgi:hypothetical protein
MLLHAFREEVRLLRSGRALSPGRRRARVAADSAFRWPAASALETSGHPSIYMQAFINLISNPDILSKFGDEALYSPPQQAEPKEETMKKEPNKYIASLSRKKRVTVIDMKEDTARLLAEIKEVRKGIVSARKRLSGNQPR